METVIVTVYVCSLFIYIYFTQFHCKVRGYAEG